MADDIVQRAGDHLERTLDRVVDEQREVPELTKVRAKDLPEVKVHGMKVEHVEIDCDLCDHVAVGPYEDGWETPEQSRPPARPYGEKSGPTYLSCRPCKESWEAANYDDSYERCDERVREPVATWLNSLVTPFGITIRNVIHVHT